MENNFRAPNQLRRVHSRAHAALASYSQTRTSCAGARGATPLSLRSCPVRLSKVSAFDFLPRFASPDTRKPTPCVTKKSLKGYPLVSDLRDFKMYQNVVLRQNLRQTQISRGNTRSLCYMFPTTPALRRDERSRLYACVRG